MNELFSNDPRSDHLQLLNELLRKSGISISPVGLIDWSSVEQELAVELPVSFKDFCGSLAAGMWGNYLTLASPVAAADELRLNRDYLDKLLRCFSGFSEIRLYPAIPGYLIFGESTLRTHLAYRVESDDGRLVCGNTVFLLEMVAEAVENSGIQIAEFLYRSITNNPPLTGTLSGAFHEWIFKDGTMPLFSPIGDSGHGAALQVDIPEQ